MGRYFLFHIRSRATCHQRHEIARLHRTAAGHLPSSGPAQSARYFVALVARGAAAETELAVLDGDLQAVIDSDIQADEAARLASQNGEN